MVLNKSCSPGQMRSCFSRCCDSSLDLGTWQQLTATPIATTPGDAPPSNKQLYMQETNLPTGLWPISIHFFPIDCWWCNYVPATFGNTSVFFKPIDAVSTMSSYPYPSCLLVTCPSIFISSYPTINHYFQLYPIIKQRQPSSIFFCLLAMIHHYQPTILYIYMSDH